MKAMFCCGTAAADSFMFSTWAPPKNLATSRRRSAPSFIMSPIRQSMAWTPKRVASASAPLLPAPRGSMKWFMPPTRRMGSKRHTEMQDPRSVLMTAGPAEAWTPPM